MSTLQGPHEKTNRNYAESKLAHRYLDGLQGTQIDAASAAFKLAYADSTQDFLVAPFVLQTFDESVDALKEWFRVVKDGGYIVLTVQHSDGSEKQEDRNHFTEGLQSLGWRLIEVQDPDDLYGTGFTIVVKVQKHNAADPAAMQTADLEFFLDYSIARNLIPQTTLERMLGRMVVALDRLSQTPACTVSVKQEPRLERLTVPAPPPGPLDWNDEGVVILKNFIPDDMMKAYEERWIACNGAILDGKLQLIRPDGWPYCTPYVDEPALLEILSYGPMHDEMRRLIGEPAGVHLNLTGWVTTRRDFHQDSYLNPQYVGDYYIAVWIALDDIHPDSGPFQYVPGSHRWPQVTREKILAALEPHERNESWPYASERILTPLFEAEIERRGIPPVTYLPKRGDVLFWNSRLLHRGSKAKIPGMVRKSLIAHFSGVHHRHDMPQPVQHGGGYYFPIHEQPAS